ncbi:putative C6 finger domain protein [Pyronema omphalodes]|nr:putative C6 finger domain protein [Pyronema omphalodes]
MASDGYSASSVSEQQPLTSPSATEEKASTNAPIKEDGDGNGSNGGSGEGAKGSKVSRKRTKTGCLTCRKRRIKCGEERPTCNNCIKSKRVCEGYNQRVVFKDGMHGLFPPRGMGGTLPGRFPQPYIQPAPPGPARPLAPASALPVYRSDEAITPLDRSLPPHLRQHYAERAQHASAYDGVRHLNVQVPLGALGRSADYYQEPLTSPQYADHQYSAERYGQPQQTPISATASHFGLQAAPCSANAEPSSATSVFGAQPYPQTPHSYSAVPQRSQPSGSTTYSPTSSSTSTTTPESSVGGLSSQIPLDYSNLEFSSLGMMPPEEPEFDYDHESEDEMDSSESDTEDISTVLEPFSQHLDEHSRISFRSFLPEPGVLSTYEPNQLSSPLMNPTTAKIFCHFVYVLGPSMSLFERHPPNPHIAFTPGAGLHGPQNVWSYTIPILSLSHPPLLHAILALSSLHISKLTSASSQPSLLHYHIALRRLGKAIASDKHRGHVATLAATLMLAYYETMAAEHDKWSSHIHGAKQLLKEIDFDRVTKRVELMDDDELNGGLPPQPHGQYTKEPSLLAKRKMRRQMIADDDHDDSLKSYLMGNKGRRGSPPKAKNRNAERPFSKKELEHLRLQADMFWWYAKMDCYQSLLSGCPLVLDYVHWDQCPPRARIGTLGATHGSSDHYFLLLGRLCDFQVRDLKRKRAVLCANGGQWIPPPSMGGPSRGARRASHVPPPPPYGAGPSLDGVPFGMIPLPTGPPLLPRAFQTGGQRHANHHHVPEPLSETEDLDALTLEAEQEWNDIAAAFNVLQESLGPDFAPLGLDYSALGGSTTPFGSPIYYKTYSIASLQMLYNMAMLVLHRCHPAMPPIAMMATRIAAPKTAHYAVNIARILAGLVPTDKTAQINPALGASLIESTMPIFFAAVQYQSGEERRWVVSKLREVNRLTGWATASRILLGCQRAWEKMAEFGGERWERDEGVDEEIGMMREYQSYAEEVKGGNEQGGFLWKIAGRRTVDAAGVLGAREEW